MASLKIPFVSTTLHPELYHGDVLRPPFFEGWYFKVVDANHLLRFVFIPGIFKGRSAEDSHAFVQVLDGATGQVEYHRFPVEAFHAASDAFDVSIGANRFSLDCIELDLHNANQTVNGKLCFDTSISWPVRPVSPGAMGWFAWVPRMECYHGVLGFDHEVRGRIEVDRKTLDFTGGRGYIEKDWGHAFPQAWVWMQSNHFKQPHTTFTASVAIIPWMNSSFAGFIAGFWQDGRLHRFTTYLNSRILALDVDAQHVHWVMRNRTHRIEIFATRSEGGLLLAPTPEGMGRRIAETLGAKIEVRLIHLKTDVVEFEGTGEFVGLEAVGDLNRLQQMVRKQSFSVLKNGIRH